MSDDKHTLNMRLTPKGDIEGHFRRDVRTALDLDIFTRDEAIIDEIRRLKELDRQMVAGVVLE